MAFFIRVVTKILDVLKSFHSRNSNANCLTPPANDVSLPVTYLLQFLFLSFFRKTKLFWFLYASNKTCNTNIRHCKRKQAKMLQMQKPAKGLYIN